MSQTRRLSGYTLFPTCSPLSVSEDSKENPLQLNSNNPTPPPNDGRSTNNPILLVNRKLRQKMGRLIPLKLGSPSVTGSPSPPLPPKDSVIQKMKSSKASRPGPVTDLVILPYTEKDWRSVMNEVKDLYLKGQYKHCSMRCKQILDSIKDSYHVHPLYLIYLSFFAASSLEMTASSLHNHSSTKLPLYQEALAYYQKATSHLDFAAFSANPNLIRGIDSSVPSSARSSIDSIFSQDSTRSFSSVASSPPPTQSQGRERKRSSSPSRFLNDALTPELLRTKKKVSFSPSTLPSPNTIARPESRGKRLQLMTPKPTIDEAMLLDAFPTPPSQTSIADTETAETSNSSTLTAQPELKEEDHKPCTTAEIHITRYSHLLHSLSTQLIYHITSIHAQISTLSASRKARRNGLDFGSGVRRMSIEGVNREDIKKTELRERIERLKGQGWERRRFDSGRYQRLAERALEEVGEAKV